MSIRRRIPRKTETDVLYRNDMTCCICRNADKGIQIHHIDGNRNNNDSSNLAVVCTTDHDKIQKAGGLTKDFSPEVVRKYKQNWESTVLKERNQRRDSSKTLVEKAFFKYETKRIVYELVSIKDNDIDGIARRLEYLYYLQILEVPTFQVLNDLDDVTPFFAYSQANKACLVVEQIAEFLSWLRVGPEHFKITKTHKDCLNLAIKIIGQIGEACAIVANLKTLKCVSRAFAKIWATLVSYNLQSHALKLSNHLKKIIETCQKAEEGTKPFDLGVEEMTKLRQGLEIMAEHNLKLKGFLKMSRAAVE
jgi:hypothetical protein